MALFAEFCGGAYQGRSPTIDAEVCLNLFLDTTKSAGDAKRATLLGTPGLRPLFTAPTTGCRGIFDQDDRTWAVIGPTLYEIVAGALVSRGTMVSDGDPVCWASNGRGGEQLLIVSAGLVYLLNFVTNILSGPAQLPLSNPVLKCAFLDQYFLLLEADTNRVWFSTPQDGAQWDALDFFARNDTSDNLIGMIVLRDRLWVLGSATTSIYYDAGDPLNPFQPYPGSLMNVGAVSPYAITVVGDLLLWLAQDAQGRAYMVTASSSSPAHVSTTAIEFTLSTYATITDAEVLAYTQEGHTHVCWTFPSSGDTWAYDVMEGQWHARESSDPITAQRTRWRARGVASTTTYGILVGDYATGTLYALDLDTFTDNGALIRRVRRAPYLSGENQWLFLESVELGLQAGVGTSTGVESVDPHLVLNISRDSAHTWVSAGTARAGRIGEYLTRAIWRRCGRARADRLVLEIVQTDPVRAVWGPGLWLQATAGTGAL
jgi:hypothetical protein